MIVYVKKHAFGSKTTMEAISTDALNNVEELEFGLGLEDAAWLGINEKWILVDHKIKIKDLPDLLLGDGRTPETAFEVYKRIGGIFIDSFNGVAWGVSKLASWVIPRRSQQPAKDAELGTCNKAQALIPGQP